jgi:hypothetical protein
MLQVSVLIGYDDYVLILYTKMIAVMADASIVLVAKPTRKILRVCT